MTFMINSRSGGATVLRAVVAFIVATACGCSAVSSDAANLVGRPVPEGRLMLLEGGDHVALTGKAGTNLAILFWATWCSHSRSTIADFEDLAREYAWRGDLEFYAVSLDKNADQELLQGRIKAQELTTVKHVFSGNDVQDEAYLALKGTHVPYVVFVDARGIVRFVDLGVGELGNFLAQRFATRHRGESHNQW
jgi:thiol-disulfide isomerase/thioredoxin